MGIFDADQMKARRLRLGWTQGEAATKAGIGTAQSWSNFENGHREPNLSQLAKIARALKCKPADLLK